MANPIWRPEKYYIPIKNWTRGFEGAQIMQLLSDFENFGNPKWLIQYGGRNTLNIISLKIGQWGLKGRRLRICYQILLMYSMQSESILPKLTFEGSKIHIMRTTILYHSKLRRYFTIHLIWFQKKVELCRTTATYPDRRNSW